MSSFLHAWSRPFIHKRNKEIDTQTGKMHTFCIEQQYQSTAFRAVTVCHTFSPNLACHQGQERYQLHALQWRSLMVGPPTLSLFLSLSPFTFHSAFHHIAFSIAQEMRRRHGAFPAMDSDPSGAMVVFRVENNI